MIQKFDVEAGDEIARDVGFPGIVPVLGAASLPIRTLAPTLGQHTDEVLRRYDIRPAASDDDADGTDATEGN
jgi:formyl-CoA transferase